MGSRRADAHGAHGFPRLAGGGQRPARCTSVLGPSIPTGYATVLVEHPCVWACGRAWGARLTVLRYWSIMTLTTIGYGDVIPQTNEERIVAMVRACGRPPAYGSMRAWLCAAA
jgi:hypothetical protein